jgi:glycosyltransferase involved in cell wall biosynthesis
MPERAPIPTVSVVVPVYDSTRFIADALRSVLAQTRRDFDIIVVNDGCPDTVALERELEPFRPHIRYLKQQNGGVAAARNTAIRASEAEYIALLDADDLWEPQYLEKQVAYLENHREVDVVFPDAVLFGDSPLAGRRYMELCPSRGPITIEGLLSETCSVYISVLGRRSIFLKAGLFNPNLRAAEDFELWIRILLSGGRIEYQREVLARRRKHPTSLSSDRSLQARRVITAVSGLLSDPRPQPEQRKLMKQFLDQFAARVELHDGKRAILAGRTADAARHLEAANEFFRSVKLSCVLHALRFTPVLFQQWYRLYTWSRRTAAP